MNAQPPRIAARNARNRQRDRALRPCPYCATTVKHGEAVGCCARCKRCFSSQSAFDAHQVEPRGPSGHLVCLDPETSVTAKGKPRFMPSGRTRPGEPTVWAVYSDPEKRAEWLSKVGAS